MTALEASEAYVDDPRSRAALAAVERVFKWVLHGRVGSILSCSSTVLSSESLTIVSEETNVPMVNGSSGC
jgi:hypothetical protein